MEMTILHRDDNISHVTLAGRFDASGAEEIDAAFSEATAAQDRPAIIDMSGIDFMASMGIGLLFANSKRLKKAGGHTLVLLNPQGMVATVLRMSKMDRVMPIAHDLDEAIRLVRGDQDDIARADARRDAVGADSDESVTAEPIATTLNVSVKNEIAALDGLNAQLHAFLAAHAVPARDSYAIDLAIEELVVNIIRYAYMDDEEHLIDVQLSIEGEQLVLVIMDDGREFDPRTAPALDLHTEEREVGGLGLVLVLDLVDKLSYRREADRNRVEVRVHLISEDEDAESEPVG